MRQVWIGTFLATLAGLGLGEALAAPAGPQSMEAQLKACVKSCSASSLKADDRATCKLECRYQFEAQPAAAPSPSPSPSPSQSQTAPRPVAAPRPAAAPAPAPAAWTAADLARCEGVCNAEELSTDRATCKLQCRSKAAELSASAAPQPAPNTQANASWRVPPARPATTTTPTMGQYTPSGRLSANGPMVYSPGIPTMAGPAPDRAALQAQVNQCRAQCDRGSYANSTDKETCRLTCNTILDSAPQGTVYHNAGSSAADARRAVIESSGGVAGNSPPSYPVYQPAPSYHAPPSTGTSPPAPASKTHGTIAAAPKPAPNCALVASCDQGCTAEQRSCTSSCDQASSSATDRATCKLSCKNNLEVCSEECGEKAAQCKAMSAAK